MLNLYIVCLLIIYTTWKLSLENSREQIAKINAHTYMRKLLTVWLHAVKYNIANPQRSCNNNASAMQYAEI